MDQLERSAQQACRCYFTIDRPNRQQPSRQIEAFAGAGDFYSLQTGPRPMRRIDMSSIAASTALHQRARKQWHLGQKHARAGRWERATHAFREATELAPLDVVYALNLARAWLKQGRLDLAEGEALRALSVDPRNTIACALAAHCQMETQRYADVVATLRSLPDGVELDHDYFELLARALQYGGHPREAIPVYCEALARRIDASTVHYQLGLCFNEVGMKEEAAECFKTALTLGIGNHEVGVRGLLSYFEREVCRWTSADADLAALRTALRSLPDDAAIPTTPFAHVTLLGDPHEQLRSARSAARHLASLNTVALPPVPHRESADGRLRIGYVSSDFHQHATSILIAEMLEQHDRSRFAVTLYSHGVPDGSPMRSRIERATEHFVDLRGMDDRTAASTIRDRGVDLLIDLKGWTRDHRLGIFVYRPAPVQASFLGYPGTTGADFIDYVIGDPWVTPLTHADHYTEKIAQLPLCYQPNDRMRALPPATPRSQCGLPEDVLVLCGFNQPFKISGEVFDVWCDLLRQVPRAVLWLLEWNGQVQANIAREAARRGVDPARIIWAPRLEHHLHMARLQQADLFIDTWPCNAHTTASDALWAGVPVVTLVGQTFASRVASSLLHAAGLPELACDDLPTYRARIIGLAADAAERQDLRSRLQAARTQAPLFDSGRFVRDFEALCERMWQRHQHGQQPGALPACAP
jgi:predicted O-linked N-acetylglucosamine transferase (SPINDLY family)